jgi:hypothetical protein
LDKPYKDYDDLEELYGQVLAQYNCYMGHVRTNIGGVYEIYKAIGQEEPVYTHLDKAKQEEAMAFIQKELFATQDWLTDDAITSRIQDFGILDRIRKLQVGTLNGILDWGRLGRVMENEALNGADAYGLLEMMTDLRMGIWSELPAGKAIDVNRRSLQRAHIEKLEELMTKDASGRSAASLNASQSDIRPAARASLNVLQAEIKRAISRTADTMSKIHLEDSLERINAILDPS